MDKVPDEKPPTVVVEMTAEEAKAMYALALATMQFDKRITIQFVNRLYLAAHDAEVLSLKSA